MSLAEVDSERSTVGVGTTAHADIVVVVVVVAVVVAAAVGGHSQENTLASTMCSGHQEVIQHTEAVVVSPKQAVPKSEVESTDYNY